MDRRCTRKSYQRSQNFVPNGTVAATNFPRNGPRTRSQTREINESFQHQNIYSDSYANNNSSNNSNNHRPRNPSPTKKTATETSHNHKRESDSRSVPSNPNHVFHHQQNFDDILSTSNNSNIRHTNSSTSKKNISSVAQQNTNPISDLHEIPSNNLINNQRNLNPSTSSSAIKNEAEIEVITLSSDEEEIETPPIIAPQQPEIKRQVCVGVSVVELYKDGVFAPNM
uniref:Uncharacterized protein n=1 Tax=Panagrolaimus davidi TaxID=227884 RepID=A0A914Q3S9_9BILA